MKQKNSVVDFKAYLIKKPDQTAQSEKVRGSTHVRTVDTCKSVKSECSVNRVIKKCHTESEISRHQTKHQINRCNSCNSENDHDMVLHVNPTEDRVDIEIRKRDSHKRDSTVSVPYAKPNKGTCKNASCSRDSPTLIEDNYYFRSNLSDKMSDYEDIWKNNYADPKGGTVQADIMQRLHPSFAGVPRSPTSLANSSFEFHSHETFTGQWRSEKRVVKDLNVSLDKLHVTQQCSLSECKTVKCSESATMPTHSVDFCKLKQCEITQHNSKTYKSKEENFGVEYSDKRLSGHAFDTIHEQESDLDTDSNHGDSCHSDDDAEADTEDCEDRPKRTVAQPIPKNPKQKLGLSKGRKSVSTSSLATMKNPVYSIPFDAISPEDGQITKVTKKHRRQSAPAISSRKTRHPSTECGKLSPFLGEESLSENDNRNEEKCLSADNDQNQSTDGEEVFSLELKHPHRRQSESDEKSGEQKWMESKMFTAIDIPKTKNDKPKPSPRKPKALRSNLIQQAVTNDRNKKTKQNIPNIGSGTVIDHFKFLEDFDENQNLSSPTCSKFPVLPMHVPEDQSSHYDTGLITAEDMIALSNPDLALPITPGFPPSGPQSEYDNLNGPYIAPSGQSIMSNGTVFQTPWEQGVAAHIMKITDRNFPSHIPMSPPPPGPAPPPLPKLDLTERIVQWQQSSQKYAPCVEMLDNDDAEHRRSLTPECAPEEAVSCEFGKNSVYEHQVSSNGKHSHSQSDPTIVNEKCTIHSDTATDLNEDNIPVNGLGIQEKIVPLLGNNPYLVSSLIGFHKTGHVVVGHVVWMAKLPSTSVSAAEVANYHLQSRN